MSVQIRRHSIISSLVIYVGFAIGAFNTYLYGREGYFTTEEYGLIQFFTTAIVPLFVAIATLSMPSFIYKFFPYYNDWLPPEKNDMLSWSLLFGLVGFVMLFLIGILFKNLFVQKFATESPLAVYYYYWMYPLVLGLTLFSILEAYTWSLHKSILTNYLKEVQFRFVTTIFILLFIFKIIPDFDLFIKLYSFGYIGIALTLFFYLLLTKKIHITFKVSYVTKKFYKKVIRFVSFLYAGSLILNLSQVFDSFVISSITENGLQNVAVFTLATFLTSIIQAPQRSIIAASVPHIAAAWKNKNIHQIRSIYKRSSINQLLFACLLFILITLNYKDAIITLNLKRDFLAGYIPFIILGLTRIVDMGTGVNAQIIGTSRYWRFEFTSGIILVCLMLPLSYFLTKEYGIIGPSIANLISFTIYNTVRIIFLWVKFRLTPFTMQSLWAVLLSAIVFMISWALFKNIHGFPGLFARSFFILLIYISVTYLLKLSPDTEPILKNVLKRIGYKK